jgi:hypothetical protein
LGAAARSALEADSDANIAQLLAMLLGAGAFGRMGRERSEHDKEDRHG